jgi:putative ABC transport system permease protein
VGRLLESVWQDARYALRGFRRRPVFALTAILTLALAIGGNGTIFGMIRAILLRPLPWPDPDRLVIIWETNQKQGAARAFPSTANFFDWRERSHSFEALAHWRAVQFNLSASDHLAPERVQGGRVAATFFPLLGTQPALGRGFFPEEEQPGRDRVAILSHGFWERRFGGRQDLLGSRILVDGELVTVVGILPRKFRMWPVMNRDLEVYLPFVHDQRQANREDHSLNVYGRLRAQVTLAEAEAELNSIAKQLEQEFPATNRDWRVELLTLPEAAVVNVRPMLLTLLAAVGVVLLIACANIANLMLARIHSRSREFAVRQAVGGSRSRIIRQLLIESLLLGLLGGGAGLLFASWLLPVLDSHVTYLGLTRIHEFRIDAAGLGFTAAVSVLAGLICGLASAYYGPKADLAGLRPADAVGTRRRHRLLMFAELALTTTLLVAGGAVLKGTLHLLRMGRGLDVERLLTMQIWLPPAKYPGTPELTQFFEQLLPRVRALPGVESASLANYPPLALLGTSVRVTAPDEGDGRDAALVHYWVVSPEYLHTAGLRLRRGRFFDEQDGGAIRGAVVISERLARQLFPGKDAIGRQLRTLFPTNSNAFWIPNSSNPPLTIAGVVADIEEDGLLSSGQPQMYLAYRQSPTRVAHLLVRTDANPAVLAHAVQKEVSALDPDQPLSDVRTLESATAEAFSRQRLAAALLGAFACAALLLAVVGIYGVVASTTGSRTREIGIRAALGATRRNLVRLVVMETLRPIVAGIAIGLAGAAALHHTLAGLLVGLATWDASTAAVVCLGLTAVAAGAACIPAIGAAKADPAVALRRE